MDQIKAMVEELGAFDSVSHLSLAFHRLVMSRLLEAGLACAALRELFRELLTRELNYHLQLRGLTGPDRSARQLDDVVSLLDKRRARLRSVLAEACEAQVVGQGDEITRLVLAASCAYQLSLFDRSAEYLEQALGLGADHPVLHFGLGFSRYVLAERAFTEVDAQSGVRTVLDETGYREAMLRAVASFECGLSGGELDSYLSRWIGVCLEHAGFAEAASSAYGNAEVAEEGAVERGSAIRRLGSISAEEIAEVVECLKRPHSIADVLGARETH